MSITTRQTLTCLKKLVTVSVAGRKVAKLHMSSPTLIRSNPFFFLSFHVPWPFRSGRKKNHIILGRHVHDCFLCNTSVPSWMFCLRRCVTLYQIADVFEDSSTRVRVRVRPIQTSNTTDDVEKVNGRPGERHAKTAKTTTWLLCLQTQLLQLLLVLKVGQRVEMTG